jgi:hypothetical protein
MPKPSTLCLRRVYIALGISLTAGLPGACASVDRGNFGPFERSLNTTSYGYSIIDDPTGKAPTRLVEKFTVKPGDCGAGSGWSDCHNDRERSELTEVNKSNYTGTEYWYGWSLYVPQDYPNVYPTKTALGQFHQDRAHPVWMFQNAAGGYHLDNQVDGYSKRYYKLIDQSNFRGKWHQIEVHARWTSNDDGFFRVWVNGDQKVDYQGKTLSVSRVYFKYGVYSSFMSRYKNAKNTDIVPGQTAYFTNVKRGKSREELRSN